MDSTALIEPLLRLGEKIRDQVRKTLSDLPWESRSQIHGQADSDVIYQIDHVAEQTLVEFLKKEAETLGGVVLIAEGMNEKKVSVFPEELDETSAAWRWIIDPIDGTREIMIGKRSAFFLAAAAPNRGTATRLSQIQSAVMVEIPNDRAYLGDALWAVREAPTQGFTRNLLDGTRKELIPSPTLESRWRGGFGQIVRFVHPGKDVLSAMEEELVSELYPDLIEGEIAAFDDQYLSTGGQLYELIMGKDRFTADLRHRLYSKFKRESRRIGHTCHPYDLAATLVATQAGVIITDAFGQPLDGPMDTTSGIDWVGYANSRIQDEVAPVLTRLVKKYLD